MEKTYEITALESPIKLIGKSIRTTNAEGKCIAEISNYWMEFYKAEEHLKIPNKTDENYCFGVYSNYESGAEGYYDFTIAYQVDSFDNIPDGFTAITIEPGNFAKFKEEAAMDIQTKCSTLWNTIWNSDINRAFQIDYEYYEVATTCGENPQMEYFISVM